jgi:hypothetical protein
VQPVDDVLPPNPHVRACARAHSHTALGPRRVIADSVRVSS